MFFGSFSAVKIQQQQELLINADILYWVFAR